MIAIFRPTFSLLRRLSIALAGTTYLASLAWASPFISPGDLSLRHDIQFLADLGVIRGPVSTWPLSWGAISADIRGYVGPQAGRADVANAMQRVLVRARWETQADRVYFRATASVAEEPTRIRSFENTPRESGEVGVGINYTGDWYTVSLNVQAVDSASDGEDIRADGSVVGIVLDNYSLTVNTLERWWGPGWDGSLILSNNARPIPALSLDRNFPKPFESRWLKWIGPWDLSMHFGQMESDRVVPDAQFFGMRFNFKPLPSLEIGLSRTAQWCGEGRPCNLETFGDLLLGRDNIGDDNIGASNEPGNQLAGFDFRWATRVFGAPMAIYGQFIGEDEAGGLPSRYLGQIGLEGTGAWRDQWSYRWFTEYASTKCRFYETDEFNNCAYNNGIYQTGYRYRGRTIGHGLDNDSRVVSAGLMLAGNDGSQWYGLLRFGELNTGDSPDLFNSLTATQQDLLSFDLTYRKWFRYGQVSVGLGIESVDTDGGVSDDEDVRGFVQWRSSY